MKGIDKVYEFLKKCGTYYLATADGNQPRVRQGVDGGLIVQRGCGQCPMCSRPGPVCRYTGR